MLIIKQRKGGRKERLGEWMERSKEGGSKWSERSREREGTGGEEKKQ